MFESYVINLDRHAGRMRFMAAQLEALGLPFRRWPGTNGYDPAAIAGADVAPFASLSRGEIGAWESHRGVWLEIVRQGRPAVVLEDDVVLASDFGRLAFPDALLAEADVVKLDFFRRPSSYGARSVAIGGDGRQARRLVGSERLASAYLVTPGGAQRLLAGSRRYFEPVDELVFQQHSRLFWSLRIWKATPAVAAQMRHVMPEAMPQEIEDGIQHRTRATLSDPKPRRGWLARGRLGLRRLVELDTGPQRRRRARRRLAAFRAGEAVVTDRPDFVTADKAHVERGLAAMRQAAVQ
jgi:GR25 family glycosyltransferase involved in LPS biosynthesis